MITRNLLDAKRNLRPEEVVRTLSDLQNSIAEIAKRMDTMPANGNGGGLTAAQRRDVSALLGIFAQPVIGQSVADPQLSGVAIAPGTGTVTSVGASSGASGFALVASPAPIVGAGSIAFSISDAAVARATLGVQNLLLKTTTLDLNTNTKQTLYTVPAGKSAAVAFVIARSASKDLSTGVTTNLSFGFNAGANDWANATLGTALLTSSSLLLALSQEFAIGGAASKLGTAAQIFGAITDAAFGSAATVVIEVYGTEF